MKLETVIPVSSLPLLKALDKKRYEQARLRHLCWLEHAPNLGTEGNITCTREDLHEQAVNDLICPSC